MERFYSELAAAGKVEALRRAQLAVRDLTAEQVIDHCDHRLEALGDERDAELAFELRRDRAQTQVLAGDLGAAASAFEALLAELGPRDPQRPGVEDVLARLRIKSLAPPEVDYSRRPFDHFYYWAPFVLYGDWQ